MSLPRFAIQRPVMMSMIAAIIVLIGTISLTRLPVDLLPDISQPTVNVQVSYPGVGPLEMEELVTRPIEQAVSAVAGLERVDSTSSEGNANVRLNFKWGTDLSEAADEVRTRLDRVRGRLPEERTGRRTTSAISASTSAISDSICWMVFINTSKILGVTERATLFRTLR